MFNPHFFSQQFLFLLSLPLIWTLCIKELTFGLHFTHNLCTSLHFANNFQACKSRYELALVLTARSDYTNREISPCISNFLARRFRRHYPLFYFISLDVVYRDARSGFITKYIQCLASKKLIKSGYHREISMYILINYKTK